MIKYRLSSIQMNIPAVMLIRLLLTGIHTLLPESLVWTLVLLLVLDKLDEHIDVIGYRPIFTLEHIPSSMDPKERIEYEKADKVVDVIQYGIALLFIDKIIPSQWKPYVHFAFFMRLVGVILYIFTDNVVFLHIFVDIVKEVLLAAAFLGKDYANIYTMIFIYILKESVALGFFYNKILMDI